MPEWSPGSPNRGCLWIALIPVAVTLSALLVNVAARLV